jgi:hypothetical protein
MIFFLAWMNYIWNETKKWTTFCYPSFLLFFSVFHLFLDPEGNKEPVLFMWKLNIYITWINNLSFFIGQWWIILYECKKSEFFSEKQTFMVWISLGLLAQQRPVKIPFSWNPSHVIGQRFRLVTDGCRPPLPGSDRHPDEPIPQSI